jgi:hypothetical protein
VRCSGVACIAEELLLTYICGDLLLIALVTGQEQGDGNLWLTNVIAIEDGRYKIGSTWLTAS